MIRLSDSVIKVEIAEKGAEIISVRSVRNGTEYIWDRGPEYWSWSAPILFPFIGRLQEGEYTDGEAVYKMSMHGFIRDRMFAVQAQDDTHALLFYESTDDDFQIYPYRFTFFAEYEIAGDALKISFTVSNRSDKTMHAALGFHPGIRIPEPFDGYSAVFGKSDMSIGVFSDSLLWKGSEKPYKAEDGTIALTHELFRNDALILSGYGGAMAISDKDGNDFVRVISPDFPILGLWQPSSGEAPFVCVEPWSSYPGSDGLTDISRRGDFISIEAGREKMMALRIEFPGA